MKKSVEHNKKMDEKILESKDSYPPRSVLYPSNKGKITRFFYSTLIFIFIILMVSLAIWGFNRA
ncbi:MAG TPA: hypothetical protein VGE40_02695 [Bacilli bacterium]